MPPISERLQRGINYVTEAFRSYPHPQPPKGEWPRGRLTSAQQAEYRRQLQTAHYVRREMSRRRFMVVTSGGLAAAGAAAGAGVGLGLFHGAENGIPQEIEPYSGEIEETKAFLDKWNQEVGADANKLEIFTPAIAHLATAYFSKQMSEMFPERAEQYKKENFASTFRFYSNSAKFDRENSCVAEENLAFPAIADPITGVIHFAPKKFAAVVSDKKNYVKTMFYVMIHELLHASAPFVRDESMLSIGDKLEQAQFKRGMKAYTHVETETPSGHDCYRSIWGIVEETVVEHAALELARKVGADSANHSVYAPKVTAYRKWLHESFDDDFVSLLNFQQQTNIDGFFAFVGEKLVSKNAILDQQGNILNNTFIDYHTKADIGEKVFARMLE